MRSSMQLQIFYEKMYSCKYLFAKVCAVANILRKDDTRNTMLLKYFMWYRIFRLQYRLV